MFERGIALTDMPESPSKRRNNNIAIRIGLIITVIGLLIFLLGAKPEWFGLDRSPVIGFIQIAVFEIGLAVICIGGYLSLASLTKKDKRTIAADIGLRLVSTGYVIAVVSGMADVFGFGTQPLPRIPLFGPWQARGFILGEIIIAVGFTLLIPFHKIKEVAGREKHSNDASLDQAQSITSE